ncbi:MAG: hypothetical protein IBX46_06175 [Desulfuromonadales bacterium]|nr:hypothetical protein [Desulfuromonadales bacterium]
MSTFSLRRCTVSVSLLAFIFSGCLATPPVELPLPPGLTIQTVAEKLLPQSPVVVSPDGSVLALVRRDGLLLRSLVSGVEKKLSTEKPVALAFNPDGSELAAAFLAADGSRLQRIATSNGKVLAEISFSGRCEALLSRQGEWLAFVTTVETFRFGGNLRSRLLRWDGKQAPIEELLNDVTLDRSTLAEKETLWATLRPQLSPYGDEILFLRLHDPPAFDPYIAVVLRHLETRSERTVAKLPKLRGAAIYLDGGEAVAYGDGMMVRIVDPWSEKEKQRLSRSGQQLAASPAGEILWADNDLLQRDGQIVMSFAATAEPVAFLADGRVLLRDNKRLYQLSGLSVAQPETPAPASDRLLLLRKWRAEGLIDVREYVEQVGK